jgi:hypothetical protein
VSDGATPNPDANNNDSIHYNDHPIDVPAGGDNAIATIRIQWPTIGSDWDTRLYRDVNGDGKSQNDEPVVGTSQQGTTDFEQISLPDPTGKYVLRVNNFAAAENYTLTVTYEGPPPYQPARQETYTLTCERSGQVLSTQSVLIDRGEVKQITPCPAVTATPTPVPGTTTTTTTTTPGPGQTQTACAATAGFRSVGVRPSGRGARIELAPRAAGGTTVSIFHQSSGRRIIGERLVARFTNRTGDFTWNGRATQRGRRVTDGYYFVRFRLGSDTRRITLRRSGGRFTRVADFYRRASCDLVPSYKLTRPVFGGTANRAIGISYRVARQARVTVTVLRGSRVVKTFPARTVAANRTHRLTLPARRLARGDYRFRLVARAGSQTVTSVLVSRRL